jgi:YVTN family beta-propeller protein
MLAKPLLVSATTCCLVVAFGLLVPAQRQPRVGKQPNAEELVPTGQLLRPEGEQIPFYGRPTDMALSPDGQLLAVKHSHGLLIVDAATRKIIQQLPMPDNQVYIPQLGGNGPCGIAWQSNSKIWMTDAYRSVFSANRKGSHFAWDEKIDLPGPGKDEDSAPWAIAVDKNDGQAYVTLSRNNSLAVVDLSKSSVVGLIPVGRAPYGVLIHGRRAYVTNLGGLTPRAGDRVAESSGTTVLTDARGIASSGTVSVVNLDSRKVTKTIAVGLHPTGECLSQDGNTLFVANANSDSISVIDLALEKVVKTFRLARENSRLGSAPNAVAVGADGTLFVAAGGDNIVYQLDARLGKTLRRISTAWYPDALALNAKGDTLFVANLKGFGSRMRDFDPKYHPRRKLGLNAHDYLGILTAVRLIAHPTVGPGKLAEIPTFVPRFKHVLYIIKENQTYDAVLGDMPEGDGEKRLCVFGEKVTPNTHALAREFSLFDNFYCNGLISADGHQWTDEGNASDYIEKNMGGFSRSYPSDGTDALAYVSSGFIWNDALAHGLTFRDYGEFLEAKLKPGPKNATWLEAYSRYKSGQSLTYSQRTLVKSLRPYICPSYPTFSLGIPDVYRAKSFISDLHTFEKKGDLPNLMIMLLGNDHTSGTDEGFPSPEASAADNDLALGQIVQTVSKSKFWKDTAIFVVEDDAQDGLDHVDGHRTVALCISPYTRRHSVSSAFCNQTGMLRTIETALGLPPMNKMDASGPLMDCFTRRADVTSFHARPNLVPLDEMNPKAALLSGQARQDSLLSKKMDFSAEDRADPKILQGIIWRSVKGYALKLPSRFSRGDDRKSRP